jgi:hypothetical protein
MTLTEVIKLYERNGRISRERMVEIKITILVVGLTVKEMKDAFQSESYSR